MTRALHNASFIFSKRVQTLSYLVILCISLQKWMPMAENLLTIWPFQLIKTVNGNPGVQKLEF